MAAPLPRPASTDGSRPQPPPSINIGGHSNLRLLPARDPPAVINAVLLSGVAVFILIEAWRRWTEPPEIESGLMPAFAWVGLVANMVGLLLLRSGSKESLNVKGAYLEVLGGTLGSPRSSSPPSSSRSADGSRPTSSSRFSSPLMILPRTWTLLRDATDVLLEAVSKGTDLAAIRKHILDTPGVLDALGDCLAHHFDVEHCTFQLEPIGPRRPRAREPPLTARV